MYNGMMFITEMVMEISKKIHIARIDDKDIYLF